MPLVNDEDSYWQGFNAGIALAKAAVKRAPVELDYRSAELQTRTLAEINDSVSKIMDWRAKEGP